MTDFVNSIGTRFVCVDPCPAPTAFGLKASMVALGFVLAPCGLPGKVVGGVIGYLVGSKLADKLLSNSCKDSFLVCSIF